MEALRRAGQLHERQPGDEEILTVLPPLRALLPAGGLVKGQVAAVGEYGALCLALMAGASAAGAWCAVCGVPEFGVAAAALPPVTSTIITVLSASRVAFGTVSRRLRDSARLARACAPVPMVSKAVPATVSQSAASPHDDISAA